jgi:RNA polymerase sigma factor (sigma-70 family)
METDAELLQRFAATADEKAFRSLVERHAGMVCGVALRSVGDATMAEEIAQGVFTIFARKARSLAHKKLSGWLHDATVLEARNFSRKAARYRKVVSAYQNEMSASTTDTSWEEVSPHLDEALSRLPERSKNMVIMRFYERLSFREIASAFGKSEEASRKEVDRSVQQLGTLLKKHGITTTGAALSVVLGSQTLCVPPASAAALATASLQSIPLTAFPVLERAADWMRATLGERKTIIAVLFALTPAAFLLAKNIRLEEQIRELGRAVPAPKAPSAMVQIQSQPRPPAPLEEADMSRAAAQFQHTPAKALEQAREQAALELTRISLNLPSLTEDQKAGIQAVFEQRNAAKLTAKMAAFESGAVRRYAMNPDDLSEEDKVLLYSMEPGKISPSEDMEIKSLLSAAQFEEYLRTEETKRVSNAEAAAADVLKAIGRSIDLNPAQKDGIFQSLAKLELDGPAMDDTQRSRPFGERDATEEARDKIVLAQLTAGQAEVYSKFRAEQKAGFTEFLKSFGPKEGAK